MRRLLIVNVGLPFSSAGFCVITTALLLFPLAAIAQDNTVPVGSLFGTLKPYVIEIVGVLAAALVAWVAKTVKDKFGLDIEKNHRDALQTAIKNAAGLALNQAEAAVSDKTITVGNPLLAAGAKYVIEAVPDAIKFFGLTPENVAQKIEAQIGLLKAAPAAAAAAAAVNPPS